MKKIILTGGGSAGHVTPNLALVPSLKELGYEIQYIGTRNGIERKIIEDEKIKYHIISSGKLRRYFDIKNFTDPFRVLKGIFQAVVIMRREKPNIVFSKGGFVSVPVVIAAYLNKIPVIIHESDITPGLANKLSIPYCTKICVTFPESLKNVKGHDAVLTGTPIRQELLDGSRIIGRRLCGFTDEKPILLIIGGSLGSRFINNTVRNSLNELLRVFNIVHICGRGNVDKSLNMRKGYIQFEYLNRELPHIMNAADIVVSRAGANVIFELLALKKPNLLIPLSRASSRGDQILNAASFEKSGYSMVLQEEEMTQMTFLNKIKELYASRNNYINNMKASPVRHGVSKIINLIEKCSN
ncbi:undecaprenyldiphospho-muramoylpentapeptide beta-N-acetylglucosaminyltransferase [Clostridium sp. WLY-B-L2]|uniref:UDP-N-acetylglucosamine--N-acetylmuramyl-(pentapeptide) pyrophosphoryl-undecaprenol N-acetylglucosamine transferase n=1 Tax=Clostridium aromativorans TaxID=2836848 RepID=A0ABS8N232_9CLOT|nr:MULTISPECIES: undecaprenyldiphospho-muramoylpentapeptide beta-N-acetylglucosaminyltransferase [Clostridium]KAA8678143.1 undecaprenyldiphospho-muramoylpentapeptide beta-N-acetylglucosaminyltransferase [Clostridium sp. HV4-5-A1G]MCC9293869.1 undecaprenyldiphospho-muramoylpentapeptide beta-N-acetylglucosaminyltransferase [Clostridium aromativorans]CAB1241464.1 UDP-N-acetylglucosamine--N-acetylmuramyl-(pentapeptide) pyrophosphoryl-undecaprenol N-acetylglucosamine transferase [Clostridiaceae bacte